MCVPYSSRNMLFWSAFGVCGYIINAFINWMLYHQFISVIIPLEWRHNECDGVSNHRHLDYLLNRLFRHTSKNHQRSVSLPFVRGIHRWPVDSLTKGQWHGKCLHLMTSLCLRVSFGVTSRKNIYNVAVIYLKLGIISQLSLRDIHVSEWRRMWINRFSLKEVDCKIILLTYFHD